MNTNHCERIQILIITICHDCCRTQVQKQGTCAADSHQNKCNCSDAVEPDRRKQNHLFAVIEEQSGSFRKDCIDKRNQEEADGSFQQVIQMQMGMIEVIAENIQKQFMNDPVSLRIFKCKADQIVCQVCRKDTERSSSCFCQDLFPEESGIRTGTADPVMINALSGFTNAVCRHSRNERYQQLEYCGAKNNIIIEVKDAFPFHNVTECINQILNMNTILYGQIVQVCTVHFICDPAFDFKNHIES